MGFAVSATCPAETNGNSLINEAYLIGPIPEVITVTASADVDLPDLSTSTLEAGRKDVQIGEYLSYTIRIANIGGNAPNISMSDYLPAYLYWVNDYTVTSGFLEYRPAYHQVYWEGALARWDVVEITFYVRVGPTAVNPVVNTIELWDSCAPQGVDGASIDLVDRLKRVYLPMIVR